MYNVNMVTIDEAQTMLDEIAESLPPEFYRELNGGILLLPQIKKSTYSRGPEDSLYILGEYVRSSSMGRLIYIFFGSFEKLFGYMEPDDFKEKLRETLIHEFTHHLESLGGERGLEIKDEEKMKAYLRRCIK